MENQVSHFSKTVRAGRFFGRRALAYRTADFHLAESTYGRSSALPHHSHARAHFCLVLSGAYTELLGDLEVGRSPGDLIFYRGGVGHAERHSGPGRHFMIEIDRALEARLGVLEGGRSWTEPSGATRTLATRVFAEFRRQGQGPPARLANLVEQLVDEVGRQSPANRPGPRWLSDIELRLRALRDGSPDLRRLAAEAGVHPVYLGRLFRRAYGCSPGEFLRRLRVERAQRTLVAADAQLADVAYAAGFCDQSHLNRVFKSHTGLTPGHYRRLASPPG